MPDRTGIDVHQHLWPAALIEALRARERPPLLRGWTLHLTGEPAYRVEPADHDLDLRTPADPADLVVLSLSSPLGLEDLPPAEAAPLLEAWHTGAGHLPAGIGAWAAVGRHEPDLSALADRLAAGFVGLQVPAGWLATPGALELLTPVLAVCERADRPVLVHPGAAGAPAGQGTVLPDWWPAVVDYPAQLQAAWWSWHQIGRDLLPHLRIGFVAGAGLAPLQHERLLARGGRIGPVDPGVFVETSSYGPQTVEALIRVLGSEALVRGSDRPYAQALPFGLDPDTERAIDLHNPARFLFGTGVK